MRSDLAPDASDLYVELNGVRCALMGVTNQIGDEVDHLTDEALRDALYGISLHISRICEDWMIHSEMLWDEIKKMRQQNPEKPADEVLKDIDQIRAKTSEGEARTCQKC